MEIKTFATQEDANLIACSTFSKSRMYKNRYLSNTNGTYYEYTQVLSVVVSGLSTYDDTFIRKSSLAYEAMKVINELQVDEIDIIIALRPHFEFFENEFKDLYGKKIKLIPIYKEFVSQFGTSTKHNFYNMFAEWVTECNYKRTVKGVGMGRTVIVIKS